MTSTEKAQTFIERGPLKRYGKFLTISTQYNQFLRDLTLEPQNEYLIRKLESLYSEFVTNLQKIAKEFDITI